MREENKKFYILHIQEGMRFDNMSSAPFILAGILIIAAGVYLLVPGEWLGIEDKGFGSGYHLEWGDDFITVLKGTVPPLMIIAGLFLIAIKLV